MRWLVPKFLALLLVCLCCLPMSQAQRRSTIASPSPCPYAINWTYQVQLVPMAVTVPQPMQNTPRHSTVASPTPTHPHGWTTPAPMTYPATTTRRETTTEHPTTVRKETTTEHTYPTREETVHHSLTTSVQRTTERCTVVEQGHKTDLTRTPTSIHRDETKRTEVPLHVGEPGRTVVAKSRETDHTCVSSELRRYEQRDLVKVRTEEREQVKVHVEPKERTEVTFGQRKVTDRVTTEQTRTEKYVETHTTTNPPREPLTTTKTPEKPETATFDPKKTTPEKASPGTTTEIRWVPVVKATEHINFQCNQCHHSSLPKEPMVNTQKPQCNRPTPLLTELPQLTAKLSPLPAPPVVGWPRPAPLVPATVLRGQPIITSGPLPVLVTRAPGRPLDLFSPGITTQTPKASLWEDETSYPLTDTYSSSFSVPTGEPSQTPLFVSDGNDNSRLSRTATASSETLDAIFEAPALPPVVGTMPPIPEERRAARTPSVAESVLDPPALAPLAW